MNNETGIVRPLSEAEQLKNIEGVEIICDAVQSPGKTEHWRELSSSLDSYTYSAHKFGALKGIGFTFVKDAYKFKSHIVGGGQQMECAQARKCFVCSNYCSPLKI